MQQWTEIRQRVFCDGVSKRQILRKGGWTPSSIIL